MIQAPTCAERSCMPIVLLLLLPKSCHIASACSSCESSLAPDRSPNWFYKNLLLLDWNKNLHLKHFPLGVYETASIYVFILGLDWQKGSTLLSRKTLQHQWEWICSWIHSHKIYRTHQMQSSQGAGGRYRHKRCRNCGCLQRCWICTGQILHQRLVRH